jgi:iron complex outermembrane receptor protein
VRWDRQAFEIEDEFTNDGADDSGTRTMSALSGHVGVVFVAHSSFAPYANLANAFETPTAAELNARPDGAGGFNPDLGPQRIRTAEFGARGAGGRFGYDVALFASSASDAIVQYEQDEGRAYFRNAGSTRSKGLEVGLNVAATSWLGAQVAYTHAHYVFDRYRVTTPDTVAVLDGNRLPGVPEQFVRAGLRTRYKGASVDLDWTWSDALWADDANTVRIEDWGKGRADVRVAWSGRVNGHYVSPFVGVNNVLDERYVGAITLNGLFGRVREGAPLRNWYAGIDVNWSVVR